MESINKFFLEMNHLLNKNPVNQDESERHHEKNVREVEHELGHVVLRAVALHVPVGYPNLRIDLIIDSFFRSDSQFL